MIRTDQLTLPGFSTIKRLRRKGNGVLELWEYDLVQWKAHEALLNHRSASLPRPPRFHKNEAYDTWHRAVDEILAEPIPALKPVRIWQLGSFNGAGVLPWLQGKREELTSGDVERLKEHLRVGLKHPIDVRDEM